jgi:prepilin-type N-terminal cleavage/methylation domain-containing protein/prepilin-type processing-associated H-X9-DG protein
MFLRERECPYSQGRNGKGGNLKRNIKKKGFTLVELLTALAIITVLAGLLLPVLSGARKKAHGAYCRGNLRQVGIALISYSQETGFYPIYARGISREEPTGAKWYDDLRPYLPNRWTNGVFVCPAYKGEVVDARANFFFVFPSTGSYGYNIGSADERNEFRYGIAGKFYPGARLRREATRADRVVSPSDLIAVGDSFSFMRTGKFVEGLEVLSRRIHTFTYTNLFRDARQVARRHRGYSHILVCDGHVEGIPLMRLFSVGEMARWHIDNEPHQELLKE